MSGMFIVLQPITGEIFTPQKPQATNGFRSVMEQIIFVLFKDTNCLIRNLKHRCSPRSVPRTASSTSFDFRKKSLEANATRWRPAFHVTTYHMKTIKMNDRDVFVSDSIILANIFWRTRGFDLCALMIEPSNYCAGRSPLIARLQTGNSTYMEWLAHCAK